MAKKYGNLLLLNEPTTLGQSVAHQLETANYCVFGTQRAGKHPRAAPRIYAGVGAQRTAGAFRLYDPDEVLLGNTTYVDCFAVSEHSLLDVGPIMTPTLSATPQTRTATYVRNARRAYRSMHHQVPIVCTPGNTLGAVTVTHLLKSTDVMVFVFPCSDPWDAGGGGDPGGSLAFWAENATADTVTIRCSRQNPATTFKAVTGGSALIDVMVMTRTSVGHSMPLCPGAGDYDNAEYPTTTHPESYWAAFYNTTLPDVAAALTHNLLGEPSMPLFGHKGGAAAGPAAYVPMWAPALAPTTDIGVADAAAAVTNAGADMLILRPYSVLAVLP